jgi:signal transduction histidine kinase
MRGRKKTDKNKNGSKPEIKRNGKQKRDGKIEVPEEDTSVISNENNSADLIHANNELAFRSHEKGKREAELLIANIELAYQNTEKEKRAEELVLANKELAFQNEQKEKRAKELIIANKELAFQNNEKEKRAAELVLANIELAYQNDEKEKRAAELVIANKELAYQNEQKEKRANELIIANRQLAVENHEKQKRAAELALANLELAYQNKEKEKRAEELVIANKELAFQNEAKEKRAAELIIANEELEAFAYISSHDLQEPLRKIQTFTNLIIEKESGELTEKGKYIFGRIGQAATQMRQLVQDLYTYSRVNVPERRFENTDLSLVINDVKTDLAGVIAQTKAVIESKKHCSAPVIVFQFRQLFYHLLSNGLKFVKPGEPPHITISSCLEKGSTLKLAGISPDKDYCHILIRDKGIGFKPEHHERIFKVFQKLHSKEEYEGTGIGLAIVKKIVEAHNGIIIPFSEPGKGARFDIYIPVA